jgi:hypothetical protein
MFILYSHPVGYDARRERWNANMRRQPWVSDVASRLREPLEELPERISSGGRELVSRARALAAPRRRPQAFAAIALGALAIGALAIGFIAIGGLAIGRARIGRLQVDNLVIRRRRRLPVPETEEEIWQ